MLESHGWMSGKAAIRPKMIGKFIWAIKLQRMAVETSVVGSGMVDDNERLEGMMDKGCWREGRIGEV